MGSIDKSAPRMKKQKELPVYPIFFGLVFAALVAVLVFLYLQYEKEAARASQFEAAFMQLAEAVQAEPISMEEFADDELFAEAIDRLAGTVSGLLGENERAQEEREQQRAAVERLNAERDQTLMQLRESRSRVESLEEELAESGNALTLLQERHANELEALRAEIAELSDRLSGAEQRTDDITAQQSEDAVPEIPGEPVFPVTEDAAEAPDPEPVIAEAIDEVDPAVRIRIEASELYRYLRYDAEARRLALETVDGRREMVYREVPEETVESWLNAPSFDLYYRIHIRGMFPSGPDGE